MMVRTRGDGEKPGQYKFVLQLWISYRDGKLAVPKEYRDASTTPLEATIDGMHTRFASALVAGESPVLCLGTIATKVIENRRQPNHRPTMDARLPQYIRQEGGVLNLQSEVF